MRLYSRLGATSVTHHGETYEAAGDTGEFDFPEDVANELHSFHVDGQPMWEDEIEMRRRLAAEELDRRRDPATLMTAVEQIVGAARQAGTGENPEVTALREELAALREQLAANEAQGGGDEPEQDDGAEKKTPARRTSGTGKSSAKSS